MLLPEAKLAMARNLLQAVLQLQLLLHKFHHETVNSMLDVCRLQHGICAGRPSHDFSVFEKSTVLVLLANLLVEFFLCIGISFRFSSFCIQIGMAGPIIAISFRGRREAGQQRG